MATVAGNTNQLGVITPKTTTMRGLAGQAGKITHGPAHNKPRVHLVSAKGKVPAGVYAEAIAQRAKVENAKTLKNTRLPKAVDTHLELESHTTAGYKQPKGDPNVKTEQLKNPAGVAKRPNPPHQNNPALAGRFTPQGIAHAKARDTANNAANANLKDAPSAVR